jgi:uncharacterized protein YceH (UPF0502 family)
MDSENKLPQLTQEEIRVLGVLIEKSRTTPDYYPLTLNSLVTACNQKSARHPVVEYDDETVVLALDSLKKKQLSGNVIGGGSRALKYRHNLAVRFPLDPAELSVLCLLFLRGPLTSGEINSNSGRLFDFDDLAEVNQTLDNLSNYETPYVTLLPKKPGQKEARYCHLFSDVPEFDPESYEGNQPARKNISELEARLGKVETELAELKSAFDQLMKELM